VILLRTPAIASAAILAIAVTARAEEPARDAVALVSESAALVPGTVARLGLLFDIAPGWHLFWNGCNETGYPIAVDPKLPDGFRALDLRWPAPRRLVSPGEILDHVYEGQVLLILAVEVPRDAAPGSSVTLDCDVEWVRCREACVVGESRVEIRLPVALEGPPGPDAPLFAAADARIPRPATFGGEAIRSRWVRETLILEAGGADSLAFFAQDGCASLVNLREDGSARGDRLEVRYRRVEGRLGPARGVLQVSRPGENAPRHFTVDLETPPPAAAEIGRPAPDFTLKDTDGREHRLSEYTKAGKIVVLEWFNPDCPFSRKHHVQFSTMTDLASDLKKKNVVWLAVNSGATGKQGAGLDRNKKAKTEYGMDYPILMDDAGTVGRLYGAKTTPHMFVIAPDGKLIYKGAIDNDPSPRAMGSTVYVRTAVEEFAAGKAVDPSETASYGCSVKYGQP
jgi:DsbC/DsbD-like thiol-disulfide interchange protein/peroxiredoxin